MAFPKKPSLLMKYKDEKGDIYQYTNYGWVPLSRRASFKSITRERKGLRPSDRFMNKHD